ncbi:Uncharacterized conserved protein YndB, AHSA1/START domain [Polaromonas sp. OV174]|uniref:SRPBCC family protein n=1 Tax=Polaromonas sp. OV174 TaxID=1855300 RepID=UPI0008ED819B|nr:SRPBCC domain-containing protein [Polaromonas sp. OV174]SFB73614.1 Uncharacterized conserved protein YndB, AHSA1/START domain [Polaromonas sp. OV174]
MKHYQRQILLSAPPAVVYQALSTPEGLRNWWTQTCDIAAAVGGQSTFRFGEHYKVMQIKSLLPGHEVRWHCVRALINVDAFTRKDEWVGTDIVFKLTPQPGGKTRLDFEHAGLTPALECFAVCERGWNLYLGSLQSLVETGQGRPHLPAAASCCSA